jgi:hypothetical protein
MKRFALTVALVSAIAVVVVPGASALAFADQPCLETHAPSGILLVCPQGVVGTGYSVQLAAKENSGNGPPYTFLLKAGSLPAGLSLRSDGLISGRPTTSGTSTFGVELQDNPDGCAGCGCVNRTPPTCAYRDFSIAIEAGLVLGKDPLAPGTVGVPYSAALKALLQIGPDQTQPPSSPVAWSITAGALPPGVGLGATDGVLSGTPTTVGPYTFTVQGSLDAQRTDLETYTINVAQPLVISSPFSAGTSPKSEIGVPLDLQLGVTGGTGTWTWALAGGSLPTGVALAADGSIAGKPKTSGRFPFTAHVTDTEGRSATLNATLTVAAKLSFKTLTVKAGKAGKLYSAKIATLGGVSPVKWKILQGTLPRGVRFDKKLAVFAGTPKRAGTYRVSVQVVDALGVTSKKTFVLVVKA